MTISTPKLARLRSQRSVCPQCGRSVDLPPSRSYIEIGLGVLAGLALVLILVPLGIFAWKSCSEFLADTASHSILYHPLEDWTQH